MSNSAAMMESGAVGPSRASSSTFLGVGAHFLRKPGGTSARIALMPFRTCVEIKQ